MLFRIVVLSYTDGVERDKKIRIRTGLRDRIQNVLTRDFKGFCLDLDPAWENSLSKYVDPEHRIHGGDIKI